MSKDYDYICKTCGNKISVVPFNYPPPVSCTKCGDSFSFMAKEEEEENERINSSSS